MTLPKNLAPNARPVDLVRPAPSEAHWSLIIMTTLTQLSVGTLATVWLLQLLGASRAPRRDGAHLGPGRRPALAASTLSRASRPRYRVGCGNGRGSAERWLLFTAFAVSPPSAAALWMFAAWGHRHWRLDRPARPRRRDGQRLHLSCALAACVEHAVHGVHFHLTAVPPGRPFAAAVGAGDPRLLGVATAAMAGAQLVTLALRFLRLSASDTVELRASGTLLATTLKSRFVLRAALLVFGAIALPLFTAHPAVLWLAFATALAGEILGRYLFFVSAVPKHMVAPYLGSDAA